MSPLLQHFLVLLVLVAAATQDALTRRIWNMWPLLILALFVASLLLAPRPLDVADFLGPAAVFAVGLALWRYRAMGAGDVKIISAACLFLGMPEMLNFLAYLCIAGGVMALIVIVLRLYRRWRGADGAIRSRMPYAPAVALGWLAILLPMAGLLR